MTRLIRLVARLYPLGWRERYGNEFDALLEDVDADWLDLLNVLKGALAMQIRHFGMIAVTFAALGALVAGIVAHRIPEKYVSSDVVDVYSVVAANDAATSQLGKHIDNVLSEDSLSAIIRNEGLYDYKGDSDERSLHTLTHQLRQATEIELQPSQVPSATVGKLTVSFTYHNAAKAKQVTDDLLRLLLADGFNETQDSRLQFRIRDWPTLTTQPQGLRRAFVVGFGCALGLLMGAIIGWLRRPGLPRMA
jgi:hypothetical protein